MTTFLHLQGADIGLAEDESFNKARHRLNRAQQQMIDYAEGNIDGESKDQKFQPFHELSFKTDNGGRIAVNIDKVIAVSSDEEKDVGGGGE